MSEHSFKSPENVNISSAQEEHSEHHHSHHHHHRHYRFWVGGKKSKKRNKLLRFFRHNCKKFMYIGTGLLLALVLVVLAIVLDGRQIKQAIFKPTVLENKQPSESITIKIPFFIRDVSLVSPAVNAYMEVDASTKASDIFKEYKENNSIRLDVGYPIKIAYDVTGIPDGYNVKKSEVVVSENEMLTGGKVYPIKNSAAGVNLYHLKTNTQYYFRINLTLSNGAVTSAQGSFKTADTPRILSVEGVGNLRDIGGWATSSGKEIKQGMLYRGTELDGAVESRYAITSSGVNTMLTVFGIRTDMDLRSSADNKYGTDALGASVKHIYYDAPMYSGVYMESKKQTVRTIFGDLAKAENYPVYLHCTYGLDRTGTICYLLEALLGVSEDDLMRDYQLSSLYHGELKGLTELKDFVAHLKTFEGATMQEKTENYLLSCGVSAQEIQNIRTIFLSD